MTDAPATPPDRRSAWPAVVARAVNIGPAPAHSGHWQIAVEVPVEINVNGEPFAVMLATPADLIDLALGFAHTEHLLHDAQDAHDAGRISVHVQQQLDGIVLNIVVAPEQVNAAARAARHLEGRTGCGLCGIESLAALRARPQTARAAHIPQNSTLIDDSAILRAFAALADQQPLNRTTHSVHAAAWCNTDGTLVTVREDVGRHNALDKLVGARRSNNTAAAPGFIIMTSRLSYELVYKAHAIGAQCLAAISAPTSMALDTAAALRLPLACLATGPNETPTLARFPSAAASPQSHRP